MIALFSITCPSDDVWDCRHTLDADVLRPLAFGRFADLLPAVTAHPAMLRYLNNVSSTKAAPLCSGMSAMRLRSDSSADSGEEV